MGFFPKEQHRPWVLPPGGSTNHGFYSKGATLTMGSTFRGQHWPGVLSPGAEPWVLPSGGSTDQGFYSREGGQHWSCDLPTRDNNLRFYSREQHRPRVLPQRTGNTMYSPIEHHDGLPWRTAVTYLRSCRLHLLCILPRSIRYSVFFS